MADRIDVISDVVCPWCFIGKRKLERALRLRSERDPRAPEPEVRWHPFQLSPELPPEGIDRDLHLRGKFGARTGDVYARVGAAGAEVGIPFAFDRVVRQPNTLRAHGLIAIAGGAPLQGAVVEALFRAYFIDGLDLTSPQTLSELAVAAGLPREAVEACLASDEALERVRREDARAREIGVEGVPFFIFNGRLAVSGAQAPEVLLDTLLKSADGAP